MNNKHLCTSFCVYIYFQFSWIYTYEWILGHMVTLCLMFGETTSFPKQLHHFTFLPAKSEGSNTVHIFYHSCHSGCEMTPHCGFDLHFPSEKGGEGNGNPLQYSCLENPMDRGAWWAAVHGVTKGRTQLSDFTFTFHFHALEKEMATHSSVLVWRIPGTGAWWVAVYGVAQSRTWLKWLSSSSSSSEKGMATHSSILAWRTLCTEDLVVYSSQGHTQSDTTKET